MFLVTISAAIMVAAAGAVAALLMAFEIHDANQADERNH